MQDIAVIALGILWLLFVSIVSYVEVDTRNDLRALQEDVKTLKQEMVLVKAKQEYALRELIAIKASLKELEKEQWEMK